MADALGEFKERAKATWALGGYDEISRALLPASAHAVRVAGVRPGERVLDVGCGSGNTAITAARAGARVVGLDLTPELLSVAKQNAAIAEVDDVEWRQGDAEDLPYPDGSFDVVLSTVGHMFAPRPEVAARELVRVTKPGGRIAFMTWPPENFVGRMFAATGKHAPPPPNGPPSPLLWGVPDVVRERLGAGVRDVHFERGAAFVNTLSPAHYWELMAARFGPTIRAVEALRGDPAKLAAFRHDYIAAIAAYTRENQLRLDYLITRAIKT